MRHYYAEATQRAESAGHRLPSFDEFWERGVVEVPVSEQAEPLLASFRPDPDKNRLGTPSGRIELYSERIASFGYDDCPGHPAWIEPAEWLGAAAVKSYPLHLLSNQPTRKLHSQYDHGAWSRAAKIKGREPIRIHPVDAGKRGSLMATLCGFSMGAARCWPARWSTKPCDQASCRSRPGRGTIH